jgi:hypothetical protein
MFFRALDFSNAKIRAGNPRECCEIASEPRANRVAIDWQRPGFGAEQREIAPTWKQAGEGKIGPLPGRPANANEGTGAHNARNSTGDLGQGPMFNR